MRINIIGSFKPNTGLHQDMEILRGIITGILGTDDIKMRRIPHMFPQCDEAEVNIFVEDINPSLFPYARKNIWIPNPDWTRRAWIPYIEMVDEIWAKTHECKEIFEKLTDGRKTVHYIGWSSIDKCMDFNEIKKNYSKALVVTGKNIFRHPRPILHAYRDIYLEDEELFNKLPELNIVFNPENVMFKVPEEIKSKVNVIGEVLKEEDYNNLLRECGLCVCLSFAEGFGHAVNEAMSAGCNLLLSPIRPFTEDLVGELQIGTYYASYSSVIEHPECTISLLEIETKSVVECLRKYVNDSADEKHEGSKTSRQLYEYRHKLWLEVMKSILQTWDVKQEPYTLKDVMPKEADLPDISILTITKDRRIFMPLAKYSYMIQSYPEDKLEWVIVDDGDDPIEDTLIGVPNVKYVKCDPGMTISQKRNLAVESATYDTFVNMDDDDVYPNNSVIQRVAMMLMEPKKECAFCATIPCYDITKFNSFMNVPPMALGMADRVSEATLVFTRKFWEEGKFDDSVHIAEGNAFIRGREQMCREISPQDVIVSLIHPKNTSSRKSPEVEDPNGCHYGFNEQLFAMVSQIGVELSPPVEPSTSCQKESGDGDDVSTS